MLKFSRIFVLIIAICMITACSKSTNYAPVVNAWEQPANKQGGYKVQADDTLYSIAWAYGIDYRELAKINNLQPPYAVTKGQLIYTTTTAEQKQAEKKVPKIAEHPQKIVSNWVWPTKGTVISQFSLQRPINKGINIAGKYGQAIYAANSGKIVYSGNGINGYGNLIIIKHNDEYLSAYAHNKTNLAKEGQWVKKGQQIALMGNGNSQKPELHFEIRYKGKPINPLTKLPKE